MSWSSSLGRFRLRFPLTCKESKFLSTVGVNTQLEPTAVTILIFLCHTLSFSLILFRIRPGATRGSILSWWCRKWHHQTVPTSGSTPRVWGGSTPTTLRGRGSSSNQTTLKPKAYGGTHKQHLLPVTLPSSGLSVAAVLHPYSRCWVSTSRTRVASGSSESKAIVLFWF